MAKKMCSTGPKSVSVPKDTGPSKMGPKVPTGAPKGGGLPGMKVTKKKGG